MTRYHSLRPADHRLLLWCFALSLALHAALLPWMPELRSPHEAPARPLTVELARPEPPPVTELPKPEPARIIAPPQYPAQQRTLPEPRPQPRTEEKAPAVLAIPPVTAAPAESPPPVFTVPEPVKRAPEPPRVSASPAAPPAAPRVRTNAAYLHNPLAYPMAARRRGDQGTVMVKVTVSAEGLPVNVSLDKTSGMPVLDEAALNAVRSWRFVPARDGGQAVEALYIVPVVYKLN